MLFIRKLLSLYIRRRFSWFENCSWRFYRVSSWSCKFFFGIWSFLGSFFWSLHLNPKESRCEGRKIKQISEKASWLYCYSWALSFGSPQKYTFLIPNLEMFGGYDLGLMNHASEHEWGSSIFIPADFHPNFLCFCQAFCRGFCTFIDNC